MELKIALITSLEMYENRNTAFRESKICSFRTFLTKLEFCYKTEKMKK